jgi:hypothetical protein
VRLRLFLRAAVVASVAACAAPGSLARAQTSAAWANDLTNLGETALPHGALDVHLGIGAIGGPGSRYEVVCPDLGPGCGTATPPAPYDTRLPYFAAGLPLDIAYGLTRSVSLELRVPFHIYVVRPLFSTTAGMRLDKTEDIHHHPETDVGVGDPWVGARHVVAFHHLMSTTRFGLSLPFGATSPNPYVLATEGLWHEHVQFGSGTLIPVIGSGLGYSFRRFTLDVRAVATLSIYENGYGYKAPSQFLSTIHATVPFFSRVLQTYAAIDLPASGPTHWSVLPPGFFVPPPHAVLLAGGGFFWVIHRPIYWDFNFRIHIANIGPGPTFPGTLSLGVGARFDGSREQPAPEPMHEY